MDIEFVELIQNIMDVQAGLAGTCGDGIYSSHPADTRCYASAFTAVGAAFSTMGYWVQSDLLDEMIFGGMGLYAPLIYILSAAGGIISMALGQPPRNYLWFFMGPAIFNWLLDTRTAVTGVAWRVADRYQDQAQVWKLAEVGLVNTTLFDDIMNYVGGTTSTTAPYVSSDRAPNLPLITPLFGSGTFYPVRVAMPFLWFDALVSDTVQNIVKWTGIYNQREHLGAPPTGAVRSNLNIGDSSPDFADDEWFLLSNLKWTYLDDITGAKLANPLMRDAFVTFLGSECGDMLKASVHAPAFTAAAHTKGYGIPTSVFKTEDSAFFNYRILKANLRSKAIPTPETLKDVLQEESGNSFRKAVASMNWDKGDSLVGAGNVPAWYPDDTMGAILAANRIRCDTYLDLLILFFRWEASNIYQMTFVNSSGLGGLNERQIVFNLLYGWDIKKNRSRAVVGPGVVGSSSGVYLKVGNGDPLDMDDQINFVHNLILVHLFRNEFATAPAPVDVRYRTSQQAVNYVEAYQRTVGSKSKYGEVYTWALIIPYLQGILLYLLAIGYPFACVMIIMPGMHKTIFTWMSFWAWVKLWDLGFAIVMSLERSVWAMIGNKAQITSVFDRVVEMDLYGRNVEAVGNCSASPVSMGGCLNRFYQVTDAGYGLYPIGGNGAQFVKALPVAPPVGTVDPLPSGSVVNYTIDTFDGNLRFLDLGMTLAASLDLDLANGYYIYIMAALYMAVPAVTGQLVLGAKAGAASMVGTAIGGTAQESGRIAGTGYQGDVVQRMKSNASSLGQASTAKSHRASGMAAQALGFGNASANAAMKGAYFDQVRAGHGNLASIAGNNRQENDANLGAGTEAISAATGIFGGGGIPKDPRNPGGDPANGGGGGGGGGRGGMGAGQGLSRIGRALGGLPAGVGGPLGKSQSAAGMLKAVQAAGQADHYADYAQASAQHIAGQADAGIAGFGAGQESKGYGEHAGRMNAAANHRAGMDKWKAMTKFANQLSGTSAALGLFAGGLDAGPKPEEATGMAMSGMLGSDAKNKANFFNPNRSDGFFGMSSSAQGRLQSRYGGNQMLAARAGGVRAPFDAFRNALGAAAGNMTRINDVGPVSDGSAGNG